MNQITKKIFFFFRKILEWQPEQSWKFSTKFVFNPFIKILSNPSKTKRYTSSRILTWKSRFQFFFPNWNISWYSIKKLFPRAEFVVNESRNQTTQLDFNPKKVDFVYVFGAKFVTMAISILWSMLIFRIWPGTSEVSDFFYHMALSCLFLYRWT